MRNYEISEDRLRRLVEAELELAALQQGGVDNWPWYGESCHDFIGEMAKELNIDPYEADFEILAKYSVEKEFKQKEV